MINTRMVIKYNHTRSENIELTRIFLAKHYPHQTFTEEEIIKISEHLKFVDPKEVVNISIEYITAYTKFRDKIQKNYRTFISENEQNVEDIVYPIYDENKNKIGEKVVTPFSKFWETSCKNFDEYKIEAKQEWVDWYEYNYNLISNEMKHSIFYDIYTLLKSFCGFLLDVLCQIYWLINNKFIPSIINKFQNFKNMLEEAYNDSLLQEYVNKIILKFNEYTVKYSCEVLFKNISLLFNFTIHYIYLFILAVIYMLILTLVIASITLVERKTLSLIQRRVGPNQTGFRGRVQFIADALKLLNKTIFVLRDNKRSLFVVAPMIALFAAYTFWINAVWGPNLSLVNIEYNILFMGLFSFLFSTSILLVSIYSKNKYCILACLRSIFLTATLELVWGFTIIILCSYQESFSFDSTVLVNGKWLTMIFVLAPILPIIVLIYLLETARIPFDLVEAEAELVAGYTNELGGFFFALFYLGEYFHLFFASLFFAILFFGF